jgi:DNA-binding helix-hairpin-helix protein with protein kinase domain
LRALDIASFTSLLNKLQLPTTVPQVPVAVPAKPVPAPVPPVIGRRRIAAGLLGTAAVVLLLATCAGGMPDIAGLIALALGGVAFAVRPGTLLEEERQRRQKAKLDAQSAWRQLTEGWRRDCSAAIAKFHAKRAETERHLSTLQELPAARQAQLKKLHQERERHQRQVYLEQFDVETAKLPGIGAGLKAMLVAYGFDTAHDITWAVGNVKGIGPVKLDTLLAWRRSLEAQFKFDPALGVSPAQRAAVEREMLQRRRELERLLAQGAHELPVLHQRAVTLLSPDRGRFNQAARQLAQALADADVV